MSTNDPLGILSLTETIQDLKGNLDQLEKVLLFGEELPITEEMIIERTGINVGTLYSLRKEGKLRFHKPGKSVMYFASEFAEDIRAL